MKQSCLSSYFGSSGSKLAGIKTNASPPATSAFVRPSTAGSYRSPPQSRAKPAVVVKQEVWLDDVDDDDAFADDIDMLLSTDDFSSLGRRICFLLKALRFHFGVLKPESARS